MPPFSLSPRSVVAFLGARWEIDREVRGGYIASDAYLHDSRLAVCLELTRGPRTITIEVAVDDPAADAASRGGGLMVSHGPTSEIELAQALCDLVAECAPTHDAWQLTDELPPLLETEVTWRPATTENDPDDRLLRRDATSYRRLHGVRPEPRQVLVAGEPIAGVSVFYPRPLAGRMPASGSIYQAPRHFATRRRFRRYFASLGIVFERDGTPRTVPTPTTFHEQSASPVRLELVAIRTMAMSDVRWVKHLLRKRTLPVTVAPAWAAAAGQLTRRIPTTAEIPVDVGMLVHDLSLHGLAFHAISRAAWTELVDRAEHRQRRGAPARALATFFESTLTRTCWQVWREVNAPEDFAAGFAAHFDTLVRNVQRIT